MKRTYIVLPINDTQPQKRYFIRNGETILNDFTASVDAEHPVFEAYIDVTRFGDTPFTLTDDTGAAVPYKTSDKLPKKEDLPNGTYLRPAAHFTTTLGWTNDPNGLILHNGKYHMFYQHNPMSWNWGNMTWGHAVSSDLVHWDEIGDELYPDKFGTMFSGSAVCDERNVAGFGEGALLLFYTAAGDHSEMSRGVAFSQCLAYSTDGGETFTKYEKNPIIPHIVGANRDPKVQWSDELQKYTLSLYLDGNDFTIFTSDNLLDWTRICDLNMPEDNECPDFYPLPLGDEIRWVFVAAHDTYYIGEIKDGTFVPEQPYQIYHRGGTSYAAQTFSGTGDRRIKIAWGRNSAPGAVFNSQMGLPVEMFLTKVGDIVRLGSYPVKETELLKKGTLAVGETTDGAVDVYVEIGDDCGDFTLSCFGMDIAVSPKNGTYTHGGCTAPLTFTGERKMRVIFDTLGIEVFADGGLVYSTMGAIADRTKPLTVTSDAVQIRADVLAM
ncbi:MAG: glycoside hydrolase family 32 protein [Clostridia bacterium]|nr:glycoside hydrolase family 32 protein [Clostridia bacterium]